MKKTKEEDMSDLCPCSNHTNIRSTTTSVDVALTTLSLVLPNGGKPLSQPIASQVLLSHVSNTQVCK